MVTASIHPPHQAPLPPQASCWGHRQPLSSQTRPPGASPPHHPNPRGSSAGKLCSARWPMLHPPPPNVPVSPTRSLAEALSRADPALIRRLLCARRPPTPGLTGSPCAGRGLPEAERPTLRPGRYAHGEESGSLGAPPPARPHPPRARGRGERGGGAGGSPGLAGRPRHCCQRPGPSAATLSICARGDLPAAPRPLCVCGGGRRDSVSPGIPGSQDRPSPPSAGLRPRAPAPPPAPRPGRGRDHRQRPPRCRPGEVCAPLGRAMRT